MVKILIVDDSPLMRDLLSRHVSVACGYGTVEAEDGVEALEAARRERPDLILMDLKMPRMDGITAIRKLRADPGFDDTPIIFLSAETDRRKWVEAFDAGANDFISKPYQKNELLARIDNHLKLADMTRELRRKNAQLEREQYLASVVQRQLLPHKFDYDGVDIASVYQAQELIGGDFFDAWEHGDTISVVMADISGHGASSALLMAVCKGILYSLEKSVSEPADVVREMNRKLYGMLDEGGRDMFVTMAYAVINRKTNELSLVSAGHVPSYLISGADCEGLTAGGPALGFVPDQEWAVARRPFNSGDTLFLLTDGLLELRDSNGAFFGEERLIPLLRPGAAPKDLIGEVVEQALPFCGGVISDDLALLAVRRDNGRAD